MVACARNKVDKLSQCEIYMVAFIKDESRRRHMRREHGQEPKESHSDWDSDPCVEVGDPCVRKRVNPKSLKAPVKVERPMTESRKQKK